jgi:ABC-type transport system involved in multi-copper enzyme maturation permease subunit
MLNTNPVKANLWHSYRFEMFKITRMQFYRVALTFPLAISLIALIGMTIIRFVSPPEVGVPSLPRGAIDYYGLGTEGTFVSAASSVLSALLTLATITVIITASLLIGSEYNTNTIKMLAIRQASRVKLVLSKLLGVATFTVVLLVEVAVIWLIFGFFFKFFYSVPFEVTTDDWKAIGEGLSRVVMSGIQMLILAFLTCAVTFRYRSVIAGLITYFLYNLVDSSLSNILAVISNGGSTFIPPWLRPLLEMLQPIQPFLLQSSINRIDMQEKIEVAGRTINNVQIIASTSIWQAWVVLAVYVFAFGGLAVWIFSRRDITD